MIFKWLRARQRKADREILFPAIHRNADNIDKAYEAIRLHIAIDSAWQYCDEWSDLDLQVIRYIGGIR